MQKKCSGDCITCKFKYWVIYEEPECFCRFNFKHCRLNYFEKKKLERFEKRLEDLYNKYSTKIYNKPVTKEKLLKKHRNIRYKRSEYLETLIKKGKISYE